MKRLKTILSMMMGLCAMLLLTACSSPDPEPEETLSVSLYPQTLSGVLLKIPVVLGLAALLLRGLEIKRCMYMLQEKTLVKLLVLQH